MSPDAALDAFVDAGLDCRDAGVLPEAVETLIETGALDEFVAQRWEDDPRYLRLFQKPRRPKPSGGCLLSWLPWRSAR